MGRLLNPGVGELVDRLTILRLKILHGAPQPAGASGAFDHFRAEEAQINMLLDRMGHPASNDVLVAQMKLQQTNAELWQLEDQMAAYARARDVLEGDTPYACTRVATEIWRLNRHRNTLINEINQLANTDRGPEKL